MRLHRLAGAVLAASLMLAGIAAQAADVPGSKDPPFLKRYEGSEIVHYVTRPFDRYLLAGPNTVANAPPNSWKFVEIEGAITRVFYREPPGHSVLELMRNYEQALKGAGFTQVFELSHGIDHQADFAGTLYGQGIQADGDPFHWSSIMNSGYVSAKATLGGKDITLAIYFQQYNSPYATTFLGDKAPTRFAAEQTGVLVDYVVAKAVENHMVVVKAADLAQALATHGSIALYGIYFDTDKTEIKPASKPTLDEVGSLLKIDRSLKLEISGHTDNTGSPAHNLALSQGRAQAVVDALVKQYGIDPARLQAKGYGDTKPVASNASEDGKAKNRRVELRKLPAGAG